LTITSNSLASTVLALID